MNPKFVHLKTPQQSIIKSDFISLKDVGLVMTPKSRSDMKYRNSVGHISNDPIILSLFTGMRYDNLSESMSRNGFFKDRTFYENACKVCYTNERENFFGFPNVTALNFYMLMLYGLYRHHPNEDYKESLRREMSVLNEIFFVDDRKKGLIPLYTAFDNGDVTYTKSFDDYVKILVDNYEDEFNQTAIQNAERYNQAIMEYRGSAHIVLSACGFTHECEHGFGSEFFHPRGCVLLSRQVRNFLASAIAVENNKIPKMVKDTGICHAYQYRKPHEVGVKDRSIFLKMIEHEDDYRIVLYPLQFQSVLILRKTRDELTLDANLREVYSMYNMQVSKMHPTGDWNASIFTDVDEYKQYQTDINYLTRRLGIKATTKKALSGVHDDDRFKLKVYYQPKSTKSLVKIIRWIAEQDKNAKITNREGYQNPTYRAETGKDSEFKIFKYCEEQSSKLFEQHVKKHNNPYYCFLQECDSGYRRYRTVKHTKIFEYCAKGWLDDDHLLSMIVDAYLSTTRITISMKCNDIKQLKKLKLMGIRFDNIEYDIADRKEVLEYFQDY